MITKETLNIKAELFKYVVYLNSLSDYLPIVERKFVMKQHIEGLVKEAIVEFNIKEV